MQSIKKIILTKKFNSNVEKKIYIKFFVAFSIKIIFFFFRRRVRKFFSFFNLNYLLFYELESSKIYSNQNN